MLRNVTVERAITYLDPIKATEGFENMVALVRFQANLPDMVQPFMNDLIHLAATHIPAQGIGSFEEACCVRHLQQSLRTIG